MSKFLVIGVGFIGIVTAIVLFVITSYISAYNAGNRMEQNIVAAYDNNRNILAQYQNKVLEASQVTEMQRDDLKEVVTAALEGRYGDNGSKAIFQAITEQNPQIDSSVYIKIQQIVESGRTDFKIGQEKLIDAKRVYQTQIGSFWRGTMLSFAGYPKIDLNKYDIVTTAKVEETFETKEEEPLKLR